MGERKASHAAPQRVQLHAATLQPTPKHSTANASAPTCYTHTRAHAKTHTNTQTQPEESKLKKHQQRGVITSVVQYVPVPVHKVSLRVVSNRRTLLRFLSVVRSLLHAMARRTPCDRLRQSLCRCDSGHPGGRLPPSRQLLRGRRLVVQVVVVVSGGWCRASVGRFPNAHGQHFAGQDSGKQTAGPAAAKRGNWRQESTSRSVNGDATEIRGGTKHTTYYPSTPTLAISPQLGNTKPINCVS